MIHERVQLIIQRYCVKKEKNKINIKKNRFQNKESIVISNDR